MGSSAGLYPLFKDPVYSATKGLFFKYKIAAVCNCINNRVWYYLLSCGFMYKSRLFANLFHFFVWVKEFFVSIS